jgi:hypothetical protein
VWTATSFVKALPLLWGQNMQKKQYPEFFLKTIYCEMFNIWPCELGWAEKAKVLNFQMNFIVTHKNKKVS